MMNRLALLLAAFTAAALSGASGCGATVPLENRPCPCSPGWTCCEDGNVCAAPGTACPALTRGDSGASDAVVEASDSFPPNPMRLATAQSARCIATDRDRVYWQNADGLVLAAPKTGGDVQVSNVQSPLANDPRCGLAVDGSTLYATWYGLGKLMKTSIQPDGTIGGAAAIWGALSGPSSIAIDDAWIYVTEYDGGTVKKLSKSGSADAAIVLASGLRHPDGIVLDGADLYWINRGTLASGDAGTEAGAAHQNDGSIMRVSKYGGDPTPLVAGLAQPLGMAIDGRRLFWMDWSGDVSAIDVDGTNRAVIASLEYGIGAIASDGDSVFWGGAFEVRKSVHGTGAPTTLYPTRLASVLVVDDARVYWAGADEIWSGTK